MIRRRALLYVAAMSLLMPVFVQQAAEAAPSPGSGAASPSKAVFFAADGLRQDLVEG